MNGTTLTAMNGGNLTVTVADGDYFVNSAKVVTPNVLVAGGVVHVIDVRLLFHSYIHHGRTPADFCDSTLECTQPQHDNGNANANRLNSVCRFPRGFKCF